VFECVQYSPATPYNTVHIQQTFKHHIFLQLKIYSFILLLTETQLGFIAQLSSTNQNSWSEE
jgi:hypothetical protein